MTITPGPWAITRQYSAPNTYCPKIIVGPAVINFLQGFHTPEEDAAHKARAEADARLIAEAPAMVAILRDVITAHGNPDSPASDLLWELAIRDARAALARIDKED